jgi:hypothetical protein
MPSRSAAGAAASKAERRRPSAPPALAELSPILWEPQRQWGASLSVKRADGSELVRVVACTPTPDGWSAVGLELVRPDTSDLGELMALTLDAHSHAFLGLFETFAESRPTAEAFLRGVCEPRESAPLPLCECHEVSPPKGKNRSRAA